MVTFYRLIMKQIIRNQFWKGWCIETVCYHQVADVLGVVFAFFEDSTIYAFCEVEGSCFALVLVFWVGFEDVVFVCSWSFGFRKVHTFRKIVFWLWLISIIFLESLKPTSLRPFQMLHRVWLILQTQQFSGTIVDRYVFDSHTFGDPASGLHATEKWTAFNYYFVEFIIEVLKVRV